MARARGRGQVRNRGVRLVWERSPWMLADNVDTYWKQVERELEQEYRRAAQDILDYAKRSHPWVNRTGQAEDQLHVDVYWEGTTLRIDLKHGVYYGIFLEKRWGGRWGVIPMSMNYGAPRVRAAMTAIMRRM